MIKLVQGFDVRSPLPIDGRILLSKQEMYNIDDNVMPDKYFAFCKEDGKLYLYNKQNVITDEIGKFRLASDEVDDRIDTEVETLNNRIDVEVATLNDRITSEVEVIDATAADNFETLDTKINAEVQTINATTDALDLKIDKEVSDLYIALDSEGRVIKDLNDNLETYKDFVSNSYSLITETGSKIEFNFDSEGYEFSVRLLDKNNNLIDETAKIDLPIESLVIDVDYEKDSAGNSYLIITLKNGKQERIEINDIIKGLVSTAEFNDHVSNKVVHVSNDDREVWNAKYDKPADGIPHKDLELPVQQRINQVYKNRDAIAALTPRVNNLETNVNSLEDAVFDSSGASIIVTKDEIINEIDSRGFLTADEIADQYQEKLTAGNNISINEESQGVVINAVDTTYSAGENIRIDEDNNAISGPKIVSGGGVTVDYDGETNTYTLGSTATAPYWDMINGDNPLENVALNDVITPIKNDVEALNNEVYGTDSSGTDGLIYRVDDLDERTSAHITNNDIHVTASQKDAWTAKYDKPTDGIPSTDLNNYVRTKILKVDTNSAAIEGINTEIENIKEQMADESKLDEEIARATAAEEALGSRITAEETARSSAISNLQSSLNTEAQTRASADNVLDSKIADAEAEIQTINGKIPNAATSENQLADKAFVNSSIATSTATFRGTVEASADTEAAAQTALNSITTKDDNDYAFVQCTDSNGNTKYKRYKYNGSAWEFEYTLNNSSFTADQWAAINSGVTENSILDLTEEVNNISSKIPEIYGPGEVYEGITVDNGHIKVIGEGVSSSGEKDITVYELSRDDVYNILTSNQVIVGKHGINVSSNNLNQLEVKPGDNVTITVPSSGWVSSQDSSGTTYYINTVEVPGVTSYSNPILSISTNGVDPSNINDVITMWNRIYNAQTADNGTIKFYARDITGATGVPTTNINVLAKFL